MRRALNARDKGCVICAAPPIICDAHHLISWIDGGQTAINNLALLCRRHHTALHAGHWTITITNGKVHVTRPTWADPPTHPKQPAPHPAPPTPPQPPLSQASPPRPRSPQPARAQASPPGPGEPQPSSPQSSSPQPALAQASPPRPGSPQSGSPQPGSPQPGLAHMGPPCSGSPELSSLPSMPQPSSRQPNPPASLAAAADARVDAPAAAASRPSRWTADELMMQEAARFAV
ncbi:HNH endonuclease signature motif containing protein [Kribbella sp. NPDC051952]|uniref:HNH endonuclease signature motif containing protein n=1 Tax=Kribbella sp. NPDC051952 TaxID=3154851 RepID=UPI0034410166